MEESISRREWFKSTGKMAVVAAAAPMVFAPLADAATLVSKASVGYQDHPSGGDMCSNCANFIPGSSAKKMGTCKLVSGCISPDGYCYGYIPK